MSVIVMPEKESTGVGVIDMLLEDIENHVERIAELANAESPDGESIEYHHGRIKHRVMQLKGVVNHHGI